MIGFGVVNSFRLAGSPLRQSMAPSQVSGKKMRTLLFGVILGIFAVVHSVTSDVVLLDEIYRETEVPLSTALPRRPGTTESESGMFEGSGGDNSILEMQFPQHGSDHLEPTHQSAEHNHSSLYPFTESKESDMFEGSDGEDYILEMQFPKHGSDHRESTTQSVEHNHSSKHGSGHLESTTQSVEHNHSSKHGSGHLESTTQSVEHSHSSKYPFTESEESDMFEGSGGEDFILQMQFPRHGSEHLESTTQSVEQNHSSQYPFTKSKESDMSEGSGGDSYNLGTEFPQHGESTTQGGSHTQRPYTETTESLDFINVVRVNDSEGSGSGDAGSPEEGQMSPVSTTQTSSLTRNIAPRVMPGFNKPAPEVQETQDPQTHKEIANQSTPGWIIIVAFIVGVAALVMLCVAIATRDKWNGPKQASQLETKTNSSNQQRELEMETFLQKDQPRENGEASEYTVIQLDDLPDLNSSQ